MLDKKLLERRINYRNFYKDKYPSREKIEEIIQEAIDVSPLTNELKKIAIDIHGPEHSSLKHDLMFTTVSAETTESKSFQKKHYDSEEEWIENVKKFYEISPHTFNRQVEAPYLITIRESDPKKTKLYFGDPSKRWYVDLLYQEVGILSYILALVANRHEVDAAFCRCFQKTKENNLVNNCETKPILFIGMGYYDFDEKSLFKRDGDWIEHEHKGGRYNIVTRERDGYKKNKPTMDQIINWK